MEKKKFLLLPIVAIIVTAFAFIPSAYADDVTVTYSAHVQTYGDQAAVTAVNDTSVLTPYAGTTGEAKRVEALTINLKSSVKGVKIQYAAHVQSIGWQDFVSAGSMAGTSGLAKRVEAISIVTSGLEDAGYVLKYRAHVQSYGWMDWKTADDDGDLTISDSDDYAGTVGEAKRVEAIEIALVPTEEKALELAKEAAKAELKAFVNSDELNAKTIGKTANKKATGVDTAVDNAENLTKKVSPIDALDSIDEVNEAVADAEQDVIEAMIAYLLSDLANYDNGTVQVKSSTGKVKNEYALDADTYETAVDAITDAETIAEAINAYENAMAKRVDIKALRDAVVADINSFVKSSTGLNKKQLDVTKTDATRKTGKDNVYAKETSIATAISKQITDVEAADLDEIDTIYETAIEAITEAVREYTLGELDNWNKPANSDKFAFVEDAYDNATEVIEETDSVDTMIETYENAILNRVSQDEIALAQEKADKLEEIEELYPAENYTINEKAYSKAIKTAVNGIKAVKFNKTITTLADAKAAIKAYMDALENAFDKSANDTVNNGKDPKDKGYVALIEDDETIIEELSDLKDTTEDNLDDLLETYFIKKNGNTVVYDYSEEDVFVGIVDTAKDAVEDATTKEEVNKIFDNTKDELLAAAKTYFANEATNAYNDGKITFDEDSETRYVISKKAYNTAIKLINNKKTTSVEDVIGAYLDMVQAADPFDIDAIIEKEGIKKASDSGTDGVLDDIATNAPTSDLYNNSEVEDDYEALVEALENVETITDADSIIKTYTTTMLNTVKNYALDDLKEIKSEDVYKEDITSLKSTIDTAIAEIKAIRKFADAADIATKYEAAIIAYKAAVEEVEPYSVFFIAQGAADDTAIVEVVAYNAAPTGGKIVSDDGKFYSDADCTTEADISTYNKTNKDAKIYYKPKVS